MEARFLSQFNHYQWAFPEIFRIPPVEDNGNSRGSLKNENLENSRGLCLKLKIPGGVIIKDNGFPWNSRGVREKMVWEFQGGMTSENGYP